MFHLVFNYLYLSIFNYFQYTEQKILINVSTFQDFLTIIKLWSPDVLNYCMDGYECEMINTVTIDLYTTKLNERSFL